MKKALNASTISLIRRYRDDMGISGPISEKNEKDVSLQLLQFFTEMEASMSLDLDEGLEIDRQLLADVSKAVDDFNLEKDEYVDFKEINDVLFG